ncbi:acylphosphatase [Agromyces intestinalis]|uniref:acylphosphatase n=1 Tax=Agromyces intestinalis TaxID=2592652 RepID=A0A5C1YKI1_9MICO|nr:acylphosphatase [Agromyces intestinalis]
MRRRVVVHGRVQGVGYRYLARKHARRLGISGWVRNLPDGSVAAEIEGSEASVATMLRRLEAGPPGAQVTRIEVDEVATTGEREFQIVR